MFSSRRDSLIWNGRRNARRAAIAAFAMALITFSAQTHVRDVARGFAQTTGGAKRLTTRQAQLPETAEQAPRVLVVGAAGKTGRRVVKLLSDSGVGVVALCRDATDERADGLKKLPGVEVASCDLMNIRSIMSVAAGCYSVIDVHSKTRFTQLGDFVPLYKFVSDDPPEDLDHPYYVNALGVENLVTAAKNVGCEKFVLVTGLSLFYSPFNPVSVLFNLLLSLSSKWKWRAETAVRESGLDYTILRPGELSEDEQRPPNEGIRLSREPMSPAGKLPRKDVAALCVEALTSPSATNSTIACQSGSGDDASPNALSALQALGQGPEHESITDVQSAGGEPPYAAISFSVALGFFSVLGIGLLKVGRELMKASASGSLGS